MAFLSIEDYRIVISDGEFSIVQQCDATIRANAETEATEEVKGYLRSRYDVDIIFSAEGDNRNKVIVMRTCDVALYHLICSLPQKQGYAIRKERYDMSISWLTNVQSGKIIPDLPTMVGPDGEKDYYNSIRYGSQKQNSYDW